MPLTTVPGSTSVEAVLTGVDRRALTADPCRFMATSVCVRRLDHPDHRHELPGGRPKPITGSINTSTSAPITMAVRVPPGDDPADDDAAEDRRGCRWRAPCRSIRRSRSRRSGCPAAVERRATTAPLMKNWVASAAAHGDLGQLVRRALPGHRVSGCHVPRVRPRRSDPSDERRRRVLEKNSHAQAMRRRSLRGRTADLGCRQYFGARR